MRSALLKPLLLFSHHRVVVSIGGLLIDDVNGLCGSWNQNIEDDQTDDVTGLLDNWTRPTVIEYDDEEWV